MTKLYSATTGGFYDSGIHISMPHDAVEIAAEEYEALLAAQAQGKRIVAGHNGKPVASDAPPPSAEVIRARRDKLLAASDWTQLPDAPVDAEAWAGYRQELRDLPQQEGFPANCVMPAPPA